MRFGIRASAHFIKNRKNVFRSELFHRDFGNPALVTATVKRRVQEGLNNIYGGHIVDETSGKHKYIRIIMTARKFGKLYIPAECSAYTLMLVKGYADSVA